MTNDKNMKGPGGVAGAEVAGVWDRAVAFLGFGL